MFSNAPISFFDCFSYVGYKFVLLVVSLLVWIVTMNMGKLPIYICIGIISLLSMSYLRKCLKIRSSSENKYLPLLLLLTAPLEVVTILLVLLDIYLYC